MRTRRVYISRNTEGVYFAYMGRRNPWTDRIQILFGYRDPGRNHVYQIWWRSVKGFLVGAVPKFALSHWLWSSSLQQCYATACTVIKSWTSLLFCRTVFQPVTMMISGLLLLTMLADDDVTIFPDDADDVFLPPLLSTTSSCRCWYDFVVFLVQLLLMYIFLLPMMDFYYYPDLSTMPIMDFLHLKPLKAL